MGTAIHEVEKIQTEGVTSYDGLLEEISHLRQNFTQEGLPSNWADLPDTGFMVNTQIGFLYSELEMLTTPEEQSEKIFGWLAKTESDIRAFSLEYLAEGLVFPIYYQIGWIDGEYRIINTFHGEGRKLVDTVSAKERNGVVKKTIAEVIEPFFLNAPDGSVAVMTSPSGPSGMKSENGKPIVFSDCQIYIWQKRQHEIVGATIRTDFSLQELRELSIRLTGHEILQNAPIEEYVAAVATFNSQESVMDMRGVVNIMRDVRFDATGGSLFAHKKRLWQEVYKDIEGLDGLLGFDSRIDTFIDEFKVFTILGDWTRQELKEALTTTVLRIAKFLRGDEKVAPAALAESFQYAPDIHIIQDDLYGWVLDDMQRLPGCSGGGLLGELIDSITPRFGYETGSSDDYHIGTCVICNSGSVMVGGCSICRKCEKA